MHAIEAQTHIRRLAHEVFALIADFTRMPLWNYHINPVTHVTSGPLGMGTVRDQIRRPGNWRILYN
ncbi:MAG TPA: hypothetical protein VF510_15090 [Ktedonobacterales bacterium]